MRRASLALAALLVVGACSSSSNTSATTAPATAASTAGATSTASATSTTTAPGTAPSGDAFYQPPDPLPAAASGTLIWSAPEPDTAKSHVTKVLYHSRSATGADIAVSGLVYVPLGTPPAGGWPVLAVAHGTTGLGDQCAPSRSPSGPAEAALVSAVATPFIVSITDYEGLGTPGVHTYLVGHAEGQAVLDSARVARTLAGAAAGSQTLVFGHSQGGGAAIWAAQLAPTYAPELNVVGAVAGAPAAELPSIGQLDKTPNFGFELMLAAGFHAAFPDIDLAKAFTAAGLAAVDEAATGCTEILGEVAGKDPATYLLGDLDQVPGFAEHLLAETPGTIATPVPMFVYQGDADEVIPVAASAALLQRMCASGGFTVERKTYPGGTHVSVIPMAFADIVAWVQARLAGAPAPTTACPTG